jgi:hypothetical protein
MLLSPWVPEARLYEGWTTARAQILAPRVRQLVDDLPAPADFDGIETLPSHPYISAVDVFLSLFSDDEIATLDAATLRPLFLPRLAEHLGEARVQAVEHALDSHEGSLSDILPPSVLAEKEWIRSEEPTRPSAVAFRDKLVKKITNADDTWAPVRRWLEEAQFDRDSSLPEFLVDETTLIDGQVLDVLRSGNWAARLFIPLFVAEVLLEMKLFGDEKWRRFGKNGMEVGIELTSSLEWSARILESEYDEMRAMSTEQRIIELAQERHAGILTVSGKLAREARGQGIEVVGWRPRPVDEIGQPANQKSLDNPTSAP